VVAGVVGAELSTKALLILGAANLFADGFSMAAANYSGTKAEIEEYEKVRRMEERHVRSHLTASAKRSARSSQARASPGKR
jgi:hypothetical protein